MAPIAGDTCDLCGESLPLHQRESRAALTEDASLLAGFARSGMECSACRQEKPSFTKATAYGAYDGGLRELIHLLKYERVEPAASVLGTMLSEAIEKLDLGSGAVLVVPVPLHTSKRRERGFNQAELIARKALKHMDVKRWEFANDVVERIRPTVSQIGRTRPQRRENIRGAFRVSHPTKVSGRDVLLMDDVMTTGTPAECARILRKVGAQKVWVATVARTLKNEDTGFVAEPEAGVSTGPNSTFVEARASSPVLRS